MRKNIEIKIEKAILLEVDFSGGGTEGYAMAWLKLTNVARENKEVIWRIKNNAGNCVDVYCNPKYADKVKDFVTDIIYRVSYDGERKVTYVGKVVDSQEVRVGIPLDDGDEDYNNVILNYFDIY